MQELVIDAKSSFRDVKEQIEALKAQYMGILASFSYFEKKEKILFIKQTKQKISELENVLNWQKERTWEAINNDFTIEEFKRL